MINLSFFGMELVTLVLAQMYKWCCHEAQNQIISLAEKQVVLVHRWMLLILHPAWEWSQVSVSSFSWGNHTCTRCF